MYEKKIAELEARVEKLEGVLGDLLEEDEEITPPLPPPTPTIRDYASERFPALDNSSGDRKSDDFWKKIANRKKDYGKNNK